MFPIGIAVNLLYFILDFGFLLPADQIIPNADEIVQSLVGLVVRARDFGYFAIPPQK